MTFRTTFPKEVRARAKRYGLGLIVVGYVTKDGCREELIGPADAEEVASVRRFVNRLIPARQRRARVRATRISL